MHLADVQQKNRLKPASPQQVEIRVGGKGVTPDETTQYADKEKNKGKIRQGKTPHSHLLRGWHAWFAGGFFRVRVVRLTGPSSPEGC